MPQRSDEIALKQAILDAVPKAKQDKVVAYLADLDRARGTRVLDVAAIDHATFMLPIEEIIVALGLSKEWLPYASWTNPEDGTLYLTCRKVKDVPSPLPIEVGSGRILVAADIAPDRLQELAENIIQFLYAKNIKGCIGVYGQDEKAMVILRQNDS